MLNWPCPHSADLSSDAVLRRIVEDAKAIIGAEVASVFLLDREREELYSTINSTGSELRLPASTGIAGHVARLGESLVVADAYGDPRFDRSMDKRTGFHTRNILCAPVQSKGSSPVGVVELLNKTSGGSSPARPAKGSVNEDGDLPGFTGDDLNSLREFTAKAAAIVDCSAVLGSSTANPPSTTSPRSAANSSSTASPPSGGDADDVSALLDRALEGWQTDILSVAASTANSPLSSLGFRALDRMGLIDHFGLCRARLARYLAEIERGYDDRVAYHNRAHAASVFHFVHALLMHGGVAAAVRCGGDGQLQALACLLAAAVHDFEHKGLSNDFLVRSGDSRALRARNGRQVNEQHHVAAAFAVLARPECDFLAAMPTGKRQELLALIEVLVLGTDSADCPRLRSAFGQALGSPGGNTFAAATCEEATLALQIALKCADLGHLALCWEAHIEWVGRLEVEFFVQGDREKALGFDDVTFLMDRDKPGVTQSQVGFFESVALPLFETLVRAFPAAMPMLAAVRVNHRLWGELEATRAAKRRRTTL